MDQFVIGKLEELSEENEIRVFSEYSKHSTYTPARQKHLALRSRLFKTNILVSSFLLNVGKRGWF